MLVGQLIAFSILGFLVSHLSTYSSHVLGYGPIFEPFHRFYIEGHCRFCLANASVMPAAGDAEQHGKADESARFAAHIKHGDDDRRTIERISGQRQEAT
jgi:hypothetical protein